MSDGHDTNVATEIKPKRSNISRIYYTARNLAVKKLGFASYSDYLRSGIWRQIKISVRRFRGRFCSCCHSPGTQIHHTDYSVETLSGKKLTALYPICDRCHTEIERMADGEKSTPTFANRRFFAKKAIKDRVAAVEMRDWLRRHGIKT